MITTIRITNHLFKQNGIRNIKMTKKTNNTCLKHYNVRAKEIVVNTCTSWPLSYNNLCDNHDNRQL